MKFETTHQLAEYLLARKERPVRHHYYYHENFNDNGMDFVSTVSLELVGEERFYEMVFLNEKGVLYTADMQTGDWENFYSWAEEHLPNDITFWMMEG